MIVVVPAIVAETSPDDEPTVATPELLLVHEPPIEPSLSNDVSPAQMVVLPPIGPGSGLTVMAVVFEQPVAISV